MLIPVIVSFGKEAKIIGFFGDCIKIRLATRPEKGKANKALITFLAKTLGIPESMVQIQKGLVSPRKMVEIPDNAFEILKSEITSTEE
jgi:uncharacterized protein YggU (UPF0235/DUF167 family)